MAASYRIILGDTCTICRAVSRITFSADRPPELPIAGCRDPGGCRCKLPVIAALPGLTRAREDEAAPRPEAAVLPPAAPAGPAVEQAQPHVAASPPATPDWRLPAPATLQRQRALADLTEGYRQQRIQGVRVVTAPDCCPVCTEVADSLYDPSVAPPLPVVGCEHGWQCRCQYAEEPLPSASPEPRQTRGRLRLPALSAWVYLLCGLVLVVAALDPLLGVRLSPGAGLQNLGGLAGISIAPALSPDSLARLPRLQQALAAAGVGLLIVGLFRWILSGGGEHR